MLKNENNALPLKRKSKVSCFSQSSVDFIYVSLGGSGTVPASGVLTLKQALESEGFSVNKKLWDFYTAKGNKRLTGGLAQSTSFDPNPWALNEVPYDQYTSSVKSSYAEYNDAAIVVISRMGCENGDLPRWDDKETGSILELDSNEREMLKNVCLNFDRVVVLLNTGNAMECGFLDEFDIDACLWVGGVGRYGIESVAKILSGETNPSGRLVDTYAYDVFSSPAMQNMGNFGYYYNGSHSSSHHYVNYAEGIYVGYKYYETRYEDQILKQGQASMGGFDYDKVVQFPFGYGLGYTEFVWDNFKCKVNGNNVEIFLTVTNIGFKKGKDVVQVYYQSPYTDYDKENGIEKSAINLATYVKTKELEGGESQNITLYFAIEDMKSYDASGKGTYLLEGSDQYYITAASDAHKAVKNAEDIYVGYKWYETAEAEDFWFYNGTDYDSVVQYPFGFGLSYTTFKWEVEEVYPHSGSELKKDDKIEIYVKVTNTGNVAGRDVVELYYTPYYEKGGIEKSAVNLCAFAKTDLLKPKEHQVVKLSFDVEDMKSYDCYDKNNNGFRGYELEAGPYSVSLRTDAHNIANCKNSVVEYIVNEDIRYENDTVTGTKVENLFTGATAYSGVSIDGNTIDGKASGANIQYLSRENFKTT